MDGAGLRDRAQGARSATPPLAVLQVDRDQVSEWVWIRASNIVMDSVRLWVGQDREDLGAYSGDPLLKAPFLGLSNQHFQLMMKRRFENGALGLFVTDHHSTNGVFIQRNGEGTSDQLTKGKSTRINDGDRLILKVQEAAGAALNDLVFIRDFAGDQLVELRVGRACLASMHPWPRRRRRRRRPPRLLLLLLWESSHSPQPHLGLFVKVFVVLVVLASVLVFVLFLGLMF